MPNLYERVIATQTNPPRSCGGADLFPGCDEKDCAAKGKICGNVVGGTNPATGTPTVGVGCVDPGAAK